MKPSTRRILSQLAAAWKMQVARPVVVTKTAEPPPTEIGLLPWMQRYLPHYCRAEFSQLHHWLAGELDRITFQRGGRLNCLAPRGNAKSSIAATAHVLRRICEGTEPYVVLVSETNELANAQLDKIKYEIESNPLLQRDYPVARRGNLWQASAIRLENGAMVRAFGSRKKIRGTRAAQFRPSLVVLDDLQGNDAMESPDIRAKDWNWFTGALMPIGDKVTNVVNVGTALHRDAITCRLERTPGWQSRKFRALIEPPANGQLWEAWERILTTAGDEGEAADKARAFYEANQAEMNRGAVVLWPEWESLYDLMLVRAREGHSAFEREKQCSPVNPDLCEWPEALFEDVWCDVIPTDSKYVVCKILALDPSKGKADKNRDYSAIVRLTITTDSMLWVDADLQRRPVDQIAEDFYCHWRAFNPHGGGLEANGFQELLGAPILAQFSKRGEFEPPLLTVTNVQNKEVRIRGLGGYLSQRRIRFLRSSPGARLLVDQLRDFPIGDHDDGPDALEMAVKMATEFVLPGIADEKAKRLGPRIGYLTLR